jgi:DNA (cytosine-5)-methyltransferase 1
MREATGGTHPRVAIAENVLGLLNADGGAAMGRCVDALAEIGALGIEWRVLDAQWFGVPQRRRRVFLVAVFDPRVAGRAPVFPEPESLRGDLAARRKTREAVAALTPCGVGTCGADDNQGQAGHLIATVVTAFGHKQGLDIQPSTDHAPTLRANGDGAAVHNESTGVRRLTPRECERLMGWPDDHTQYASDGKEIADSARYRMCGNGVAAPVAKYVAECVEAIL